MLHDIDTVSHFYVTKVISSVSSLIKHVQNCRDYSGVVFQNISKYFFSGLLNVGKLLLSAVAGLNHPLWIHLKTGRDISYNFVVWVEVMWIVFRWRWGVIIHQPKANSNSFSSISRPCNYRTVLQNRKTHTFNKTCWSTLSLSNQYQFITPCQCLCYLITH